MGDRHVSAIPHWIKKDFGHVEYSAVCSKCGFDWAWSEIKYFNYCPNCGVKMKSIDTEVLKKKKRGKSN